MSSSIYQEKRNELFNGLEYIRAYMDDLLIISNGNFEDHLNKVKIVLSKLNSDGLKINAENIFFVRDYLEYLGSKLNNFMRQVRHILLAVDTGKLRSQN